MINLVKILQNREKRERSIINNNNNKNDNNKDNSNANANDNICIIKIRSTRFSTWALSDSK